MKTTYAMNVIILLFLGVSLVGNYLMLKEMAIIRQEMTTLGVRIDAQFTHILQKIDVNLP